MSSIVIKTTCFLVQAHIRRFKQFKEVINGRDLEDNAWKFVSKGKGSKHPVLPAMTETPSKREAKRVRRRVICCCEFGSHP